MNRVSVRWFRKVVSSALASQAVAIALFAFLPVFGLDDGINEAEWTIGVLASAAAVALFVDGHSRLDLLASYLLAGIVSLSTLIVFLSLTELGGWAGRVVIAASLIPAIILGFGGFFVLKFDEEYSREHPT